jgi:hypothetical protein
LFLLIERIKGDKVARLLSSMLMMPDPTDEELSDWLDGLVGHWDFGGWMIRVLRPGRFVMAAYKTATREAVDFEQVARVGLPLGEFDRIVGTSPVKLSSLVLRCWLTPEEQREHRNAGAGRPGSEKLVRLIEGRIVEWELFIAKQTRSVGFPERDKPVLESIYRSTRRFP